MPARRIEHNFPVPPVLIQNIKRVKGIMNHTYRDCSQVPPTADHVAPAAIDGMTFAQKVHDMLSQPDRFGEFIAWMPHGRAFKVLKPQGFERVCCPLYFGHKRYSSFLRSLNNFGFKHLSRGVDRNCYYHEFMLRGKPHLCQYMPPRREARRLVPDPTTEPDFYRISQRYPLPDDDANVLQPSSSAHANRQSTVKESLVLPKHPSYPMAPPLGNSLPSSMPPSIPASATTGTTSSQCDLLRQLLQPHVATQPVAAASPPQPQMQQALASDVATTVLKLLAPPQAPPQHNLFASFISPPPPPPIPTAPTTTSALDQLVLLLTKPSLAATTLTPSPPPPPQNVSHTLTPVNSVVAALLLQHLTSSLSQH